jgi:WD40 repeat protein
MSNISVIEINDDADKIDVDKIDVDKNGDKIFTFDDINDEPHNGEPITRIEISPNEKYLVSFSKKDCSIVGWNIEDIDNVQLKFDQIIKRNYKIEILCVSDDKLLAYYRYGK